MNAVKKYIRDLFVTKRFYLAGVSMIIAFLLSFFVEELFRISLFLFMLFLLLVLVDYIFMFFLNKVPAVLRVLSERMSNGDQNPVHIKIKNRMPWKVNINVIDELPVQLQWRDFKLGIQLAPGESRLLTYQVRPVKRGEYCFGNILLYVSSLLKLVERRYTILTPETTRVYPSYVQLKKYRLISHSTYMQQYGSRRVRKTGQSIEFEQVKDYVSGDDIRTINWKATARKGLLMVNHFVDEKSQQVYCVIDKGRLMQMPFNGLSLLDYAINSALALSNICLQKQDRVGMLSFSNKMGSMIPATRKPVQQEIFLQALYNEKTAFLESDYEILYSQIRHSIKQRSLVILFTNFESVTGLQRQVNYLRSIARHHLLLVVFFQNTELSNLSRSKADNTDQVYINTIAEKFVFEKKMIVKELMKYGILTLLTPPAHLTVDIINKYLEIKARQAL